MTLEIVKKVEKLLTLAEGRKESGIFPGRWRRRQVQRQGRLWEESPLSTTQRTAAATAARRMHCITSHTHKLHSHCSSTKQLPNTS